MSTKSEVTVERILDISDAVSIVGDNSLLEGTTSYRLGRLADNCKGPVKQYNKQKEAKRKEIFDKQKTLQAELSTATDSRKREILTEVQELNNDFTNGTNGLLEQVESIDIPKMKLSEFLAKDETKRKEVLNKGTNEAKEIEVVVKKGQSLVPVAFFALMGTLVEDDSSAYVTVKHEMPKKEEKTNQEETVPAAELTV